MSGYLADENGLLTTASRVDLGLKESGPGCACCATASSPSAAEEDPPGTVIEEVLVSGMTCSHCVMSVTSGLVAIGNVDRVSVDLSAGGASRVTIYSAVAIDPSAVRAAVETAGYTLEVDTA